MKLPFTACVVLSYALAIGLAGAAREAWAIDPAGEFVEGLRQRQYHDVALDYLDKAADSPLIPVEFKQVILFEKGVTLLDSARYQRDTAIREKYLDQARAVFEQFIQRTPNHPLVDKANNHLGNLLVERGRMYIDRAAQGDKQLLGEAKKLYQDAYQVFAKTQHDLKEKLSKMRTVYGKNETKEKERLDQLRADYLQAQLLSAAILEETADTETESSQQYNELLQKAANEYGTIYEKYRTRLAGLYARMYQGRCHQKMDKHKDALSYFLELLENPDSPDPFRVLKTKTMALAMASWLAEKKYAEAVAKCAAWVDKARPNEAQDSDWLSVRLALARAYRSHSEYLAGEKPNDPLVGRHMSEARKQATFVARQPGQYQDEARRLLTELRGGDPDEQPNEKPAAKDFSQAKELGKESLDKIQTAGMVLKMVPPRLARETDPQVKKELQEQIDQAKADIVTARGDAADYFRQALRLADRDTPEDDINVVRYFLCYLYYTLGDYYDAALMGEFVARRFPASSGARQSAKIAMASYIKLYTESSDEDKSFETAHIVGIAEFIVDKWPDQPEAVEALNTLIPFMIKAGQLDRAQDYLARIPAESTRRTDAELKLGQAYWSTYLQGAKEVRQLKEGNPEADTTARETQLKELMERAKTTLSSGVQRMGESAALNEVSVTAVLSLAQAYVEDGQSAEAIALLENDDYGALHLVEQNHPSTQGRGFAEETYKTALRAYIGALSDAQNDQSAVDQMVGQAKEVMASLKSTVARDEQGQKRLVAIYVSLARDLQRQIELATPEAKRGLSRGFETFLSQVGAEASEFNVLNWVAETFYSLGQGMDSGGKLTADAKKYYEQAAAGYERILEKAQADANFITPQLVVQVRMRLAMTRRRLGKFTDAMDTFVEILKQNNMMLHVQVEAARTYQQWAGYPDKEKLYMSAILGARLDKSQRPPKNVVWGWGKVAKMTAGRAQFRDTFHEARYNLALCRFEFAKSQDTKKDQREYMTKAKKDIAYTYRLYPELGGEKWRAQYDALLRRIQNGMGEPPSGLAGLKTKPAGKAGD